MVLLLSKTTLAESHFKERKENTNRSTIATIKVLLNASTKSFRMERLDPKGLMMMATLKKRRELSLSLSLSLHRRRRRRKMGGAFVRVGTKMFCVCACKEKVPPNVSILTHGPCESERQRERETHRAHKPTLSLSLSPVRGLEGFPLRSLSLPLSTTSSSLSGSMRTGVVCVCVSVRCEGRQDRGEGEKTCRIMHRIDTHHMRS